MSVRFLFPASGNRSDAADQLITQAYACRRLADVARTARGAEALRSVANQFEDDARRICPASRPTAPR